MAGRLLILLIKAFVPRGAPVVIGLDDTIERRWGPKISARGIYRDPVRSSKGHFVKASGLRWLCAMLLVRVPWADRIMALPFLTLLAPSKRFYAGKSRTPKTLLDCARQAALQIRRWLPDRYIVLVADSAFAAIEFLVAVRKHVSASKPNASGPTRRSCVRPRSSSACSQSSLSGRMTSPKHESSSPEPPPGIQKTVLTFSDAIAAVRREIWGDQISFMSRPRRDSIEIPSHIWRRMENALAHAA